MFFSILVFINAFCFFLTALMAVISVVVERRFSDSTAILTFAALMNLVSVFINLPRVF